MSMYSRRARNLPISLSIPLAAIPKILWFLGFFGLFSVGCSDEECNGGGDAGLSCVADPFCASEADCGITASYFPPESAPDELAPYPSDMLTIPDESTNTGLRLDLKEYTYRAELNKLDGFGTFAPMVFALDGDIDPEALEDHWQGYSIPSSPVFLLRIDGLDSSDGSDFEERAVPVHLSFNDSDRLLFVTPKQPLVPEARYAVAVTRCLSAAGGTATCPSPTFEELKRGCPQGLDESYCERVHEVLSFLEGPSVCLSRDQIALLLVFTTRSSTTFLQAIRDQIRSAAAPSPTVSQTMPVGDGQGGFNPDLMILRPGFYELMEGVDLSGYNLDSAGTAVMGTFPSKRFYDSNTGLRSMDPATKEPLAVEEDQLEFLIVIPPDPPAEGAPLVLFQHAFTVCKETMLGLAGTFGKAGLAMAGIDLVLHGSRSEDGPGACEIGPMSFISVSKFQLTTSRLEQSIADLLQFSYMLENMSLDSAPSDGNPDFKPLPKGIIGQSLGSFVGASFTGLEDEIEAAVINVGGAGLTYFFIATIFPELAERPDYAMLPSGIWELFLTFQSVAEGADPANYQPWLAQDGPFGSRNLLVQEAYLDDVVPNPATELLARLCGLPQVDPGELPVEDLAAAQAPLQGNRLDGRTAGFFRFDPARHDFLLKDRPSSYPGATFRGQLQAAAFLKAALTTGAGVIIEPSDQDQVTTYAPFWDLPPP